MNVLRNRILTVGSAVAFAPAIAILHHSGILSHQNVSLVRLLASVVWGS
jgi:hypothetical protein